MEIGHRSELFVDGENIGLVTLRCCDIGEWAACWFIYRLDLFFSSYNLVGMFSAVGYKKKKLIFLSSIEGRAECWLEKGFAKSSHIWRDKRH